MDDKESFIVVVAGLGTEFVRTPHVVLDLDLDTLPRDNLSRQFDTATTSMENLSER